MKKSLCPYKDFFEQDAWRQGSLVCGIDEVGRGCFAGPVIVAAAILTPYATHHLLQDSKVLSAHEREIAFDWIVQNGTYAIATVAPSVIDRINIYQATMMAMRRAYMHLIKKRLHQLELLRYVVVDAMPLTVPMTYAHSGLEVYHFDKGESLSVSIAAASIVAKVTRDRLLESMAKNFPLYALGEHKGYGTKDHAEAIIRCGSTIIHRQTFLKTFNKHDGENQKTIF